MNLGLTSARGHHFCAGLLRPGSLVIDLGANKGEFSNILKQRFGCLCYAIEPNPDVYAKIPETESIRRYNLAIGARDGASDFYVSRNPEGSGLHEAAAHRGSLEKIISVKTLTIESFLRAERISIVDLLKIDIEGGELILFDTFSDQALLKTKQLTVEFHDFKYVISLQDVSRIIDRLKRLGFLCLRFSRPSHCHEDVLFVNAGLCGLNRAQKFYFIFIEGVVLRIRHFLIYLLKRFDRIIERISNIGRTIP